MGFKVTPSSSKRPKIINARDLAEGDLAEIVEWTEPDYQGIIVFRSHKYLIGLRTGKYNFTWDSPYSLIDKCKVRILEPGEQVILENV